MRPIFKHEPYDFPELEDITHSDGKRYYRISGSLWLPSVTTVLGSIPKPELDAWKARVGAVEANKVTRMAGSKGTGIHKVAERYVLNQQDYKKGAMPSVIEGFNKIKMAIDEHLTLVNNNEFCLYSDHLKTAGRSDLLGDWDGTKSIIDFKQSNKPKRLEWIEGYILQTVCYAMMVYERIGIKVPQVVILVAVQDLSEPQIFIEKVEDHYEKVWDVFKKYRVGLDVPIQHSGGN